LLLNGASPFVRLRRASAASVAVLRHTMLLSSSPQLEVMLLTNMSNFPVPVMSPNSMDMPLNES
jgi:hypothetical protein